MNASTPSSKRNKKMPNADQVAVSEEVPFAVKFRDFVEQIAIAVVLALLFRGFEGEAFVIPTGSMAPTLMGMHKDIACEKCGHSIRVGAVVERPPAGTAECPSCHYVNSIDPREKNEISFSGDRIVVNKFAYQFWDPECGTSSSLNIQEIRNRTISSDWLGCPAKRSESLVEMSIVTRARVPVGSRPSPASHPTKCGVCCRWYTIRPMWLRHWSRLVGPRHGKRMGRAGNRPPTSAAFESTQEPTMLPGYAIDTGHLVEATAPDRAAPGRIRFRHRGWSPHH